MAGKVTKHIACIFLAFTIIFSSVILPFSPNASSQSSPGDLGRVCVLVDHSKYHNLQPEIATYKADLEKDGYEVEINSKEFEDHIAVRNYLRTEWKNNGLVGCVIVGDLPIAWYEISNETMLPYNYSMFPVDYFYTDLDGNWIDTDNNNVYDTHISGSGDLQPEIWLGRISINSQWDDDTELIKNYFHKNHEYREGNLSLPHKALVYLDDDIANYSFAYEFNINPLYRNITLVNDTAQTNAQDYETRLTEGYEWIDIWCHANLSSIKHSFQINDGTDNNGDNYVDEKGDGGVVTSADIRDIDPKSLFYNIQTCSAANYTTPDYLCGWYAFTESYGLCVIGSTRPQISHDFYEFYSDLGDGETIGDSFQNWFDGVMDVYLMDMEMFPELEHEIRGYYYGMTIIGDPTLRPLYSDNNTSNDDDGDGVPDNEDYAPLDPDITVDPSFIEDDSGMNQYWWLVIILVLVPGALVVVFQLRKKQSS